MLISELPHPRKHLSALQSIKFYCRYVCSANDVKSWKNCTAPRCPLFPHRLGKRAKKLPFSAYATATTKEKKHVEKVPVTALNSEEKPCNTGNKQKSVVISGGHK